VYRSLDNYDQRLYQIELGKEVTQVFYKLSKKWIVAVSLNTVRTAAHLIGMGKIIDFIYEGYEGFRAIKISTISWKPSTRANTPGMRDLVQRR
jgi:hypothetical protein